MAADLFGYIGSISESQQNEVLSGKLTGTDMNSFMVLRGLGMHEDCVHICNVFNGAAIPGDVLYTALHSLIEPKRKRFSKWPKPKAEFDQKLIEFIVTTRHVSPGDALSTLRFAQRFGGFEQIMASFEASQSKGKKR